MLVFLGAAALAFGAVFLAEFGDKSQLLILAWATRYPAVPVIVGLVIAAAFIQGAALQLVPGLRVAANAAGAAAFLAVAVVTVPSWGSVGGTTALYVATAVSVIAWGALLPTFLASLLGGHSRTGMLLGGRRSRPRDLTDRQRGCAVAIVGARPRDGDMRRMTLIAATARPPQPGVDWLLEEFSSLWPFGRRDGVLAGTWSISLVANRTMSRLRSRPGAVARLCGPPRGTGRLTEGLECEASGVC